MKTLSDYDPRYSYVTCSQCHRKWQRIDYNCARHAITCTKCGFGQLPPQVEPMPSMALSPEEWANFDLANNIHQTLEHQDTANKDIYGCEI